MVSSQQDRQFVEIELEGRRQARRLRKHQADMAAAVAGAIVGVRACTCWCSLCSSGKADCFIL
jgi:hypothetical protein